MKVVNGIENIPTWRERPVLAIGNFDGVHRAHQQLFVQAGLFASNTGGPVVALTFEPHPLNIVRPAAAPERLSLPDEKLRRLREVGVDVTVVAKSTAELLALEPEQFVAEVIAKKFHPTHVVEGPNFGFGRGRKGNPQTLRDLAGRFGFEVHIVEPVTLEVDEGDRVMVSSSLVRDLVREGKVHPAALCLGRPYALIGEVVRGHQRGAGLGFPTANVAVADQLVPADGVYAGSVVLDTGAHPAAISIGITPTFGDGRRQIEAHLIDFSGDLYGTTIRVEFGRFLRRQRKFASPDDLRDQLKNDVAAVRDIARSSSTLDDAGG